MLLLPLYVLCPLLLFPRLLLLPLSTTAAFSSSSSGLFLFFFPGRRHHSGLYMRSNISSFLFLFLFSESPWFWPGVYRPGPDWRLHPKPMMAFWKLINSNLSKQWGLFQSTYQALGRDQPDRLSAIYLLTGRFCVTEFPICIPPFFFLTLILAASNDCSKPRPSHVRDVSVGS